MPTDRTFRHRHLIAPVHDLGVAALSLPLALGLRVGFDGVSAYGEQLLVAMPAFCLIAAVCFNRAGMYRGLWRYASIQDLHAIVRGVLAAILVFMALMFVVDRMHGLPRSVPVIQTLVLISVLGASRLMRRFLRERSARRSRGAQAADSWLTPILLLGVGDNACSLIRRLNGADAIAPFRVVGVLDLDHQNVGRTMLGVPILGTIHMFDTVLDALSRSGQRPRKVIVTETLSGSLLRDVQHRTDQARIPLLKLPPLASPEKTDPGEKIDFRPLALEDLLRRPTVELNQPAIDSMIEGRRIVITGAGGSIGSELSRQIAGRRPAELILVDTSEFNLYAIDQEIGERAPSVARRSVLLDVRDRRGVERLFDNSRPELVFHAAALKHVPLVESNPIEGVRTNVFGTRNVADAARRCGAAALVQISTDKAVRPTCVMGATKRLAEFYCQQLDRARSVDATAAIAEQSGLGAASGTRFVTVRFGNVLGSSGSVIPLFEKQLRRRGPLTVTDPAVTRYFMTIGEAVELVLQASVFAMHSDEDAGLIHVLDMGEPVPIVEVAEHMIRLAGFRPYEEIPISFIGLRPGEKLHEELFDPAERVIRNHYAGIFLAESKIPALGALSIALSRLEHACASRDEVATLRLLKDIVPGYRRPPDLHVVEGFGSRGGQATTAGQPHKVVPAAPAEADGSKSSLSTA